MFGQSLAAFTFRGADRVDVVVFGVMATFIPWLVVGGLAASTWLGGGRLRRWTQVGVLGALAGLVGLLLLKQVTDVRGWLLGAMAAALAIGFAAAYARVRFVSLWAEYASVAPVLFLVLFLVQSPVSSLVFPEDASAAQVRSSELPARIVVLVLDELPTASLLGRDGLIDEARFPNLRRLADSASWYRNHTTTHGSTEFAVPSLLSGSYPKNEDATTEHYPNNLFTLFGGKYEVRADEVITALCPASVCTTGLRRDASPLRNLLGDAVDVWRERVMLEDSDRQAIAGFAEETVEARTQPGEPGFDAFGALEESAATAPARFDALLDRLDARGPRTFEFLHLLLPHVPWHFYPSGIAYPAPGREPGQPHLFLAGRWGAEDRPAELGRQRHLLQVQYVDRLVGQLVATLKDRGLYDKTLLVVTADHGAVFTPGEELRPGIDSDEFPAETYEQLMWSPLIVKAPNQQAGTLSDENVQSVDLLPMMADLAGIDLPWNVDGVVAGERRGDEKTFFTTTRDENSRVGRGGSNAVNGREGLARMLAGNARAFAPSDDPEWAFYRVGPYADAIGQPVKDLPTGSRSPVEVKIDSPSAFASVDPARGRVPGMVLGNVVSEADVAVAVVVNGTLAGVSPTFEDNAGRRRFAVLIPDFLFRKGGNDVQLYVTDGPGAPLRPVPVAGL